MFLTGSLRKPAIRNQHKEIGHNCWLKHRYFCVGLNQQYLLKQQKLNLHLLDWHQT